jgi:phage shock protein C
MTERAAGWVGATTTTCFGYRRDDMAAMVRPTSGRVIAGVCAGIADHFGWSPGTVRLGFVLFGLFGAGELAYIILWIAMPEG